MDDSLSGRAPSALEKVSLFCWADSPVTSAATATVELPGPTTRSMTARTASEVRCW
ncbi:hypothetical protein ABH915_000905 [Arthrobacter sp. MW3 TE3886]